MCPHALFSQAQSHMCVHMCTCIACVRVHACVSIFVPICAHHLVGGMVAIVWPVVFFV